MGVSMRTRDRRTCCHHERANGECQSVGQPQQLPSWKPLQHSVGVQELRARHQHDSMAWRGVGCVAPSNQMIPLATALVHLLETHQKTRVPLLC